MRYAWWVPRNTWELIQKWWKSNGWLSPPQVVTLVVVIIAAGAGIRANQARIDQFTETSITNSARFCALQMEERQALRDVISAAFAPTATTTPPVIPPTPGVPQATIDLLNTLIAGQATGPTSGQLRDLLLSKAKPITCVIQADGRTVPVITKGT